MSTVSLARPTTVSSAVITSGGTIQLGTAGANFYIKVMRSRWRFRNPNIETTGDGDSHPVYDASHYQYCSFSLQGFVIAGSVSTFLLANLTDSTKNPLTASVKFHFATSQVLTMATPILDGFDFDYERAGAVVPLTLVGKNQGSAATWGTS